MIKKIGILASMSWNSERWSNPATKEDIEKSKFEYVKENGWMHEDLNFGFNDYPVESDGKFICYSPQFNTLPSLEESRYVEIVFLKSYNYHNSKNLIVGLYAFPEIGNFRLDIIIKLAVFALIYLLFWSRSIIKKRINMFG